MRITRKTSSELDFVARPTGGLLSFGIVSLIFGVTLGSLWEPFSLECTREGTCQLRHPGLMAPEPKHFPRSAMRGAWVESKGSGRRTHYRVVLNTTQGVYPLRAEYSSGYDSKLKLAEHLDALSRQRDGEVQVVDLDGFRLMLALGGMTVGGLSVFRGARRYTGTLRRGTGTLRLLRRGVFRARIEEHPLETLAPMTATTSSAKINKQALVKLTLATTQGEPVLKCYVFDTPEVHADVERLNAFLESARNLHLVHTS
ncbi:hypothetical protein [Hyalangium rubrum]|uniref:Uncharacterized protein n=1 Tax=Hyalangium rubrum TaxID=3103134 RepID=A0ABU5H043_9BACT|nr:hypothetical protein [Hyalangium sp. s54d21]MDY7226319.1 hypothetical protein [Hyalangium sp. s54d21]